MLIGDIWDRCGSVTEHFVPQPHTLTPQPSPTFPKLISQPSILPPFLIWAVGFKGDYRPDLVSSVPPLILLIHTRDMFCPNPDAS